MWTIVLGAFRGDEAAGAAAAALMEARSAGLTDAYTETRGPSVVLALGRFADPAAPAARAELERVRSLRTGGDAPYALAFFLPTGETAMGSRPEFNLLRAREIHGRQRDLYSLQVAVYGRDDLRSPTEGDLAEVRKSAEEYASQLRQQGELAWYYHGTTRSMVTVGLFDSTDFDPQTPGFSSRRLMEARQRHPYNLYNGRGIRQRRPGSSAHLQRSALIAVPER